MTRLWSSLIVVGSLAVAAGVLHAGDSGSKECDGKKECDGAKEASAKAQADSADVIAVSAKSGKECDKGECDKSEKQAAANDGAELLAVSSSSAKECDKEGCDEGECDKAKKQAKADAKLRQVAFQLTGASSECEVTCDKAGKKLTQVKGVKKSEVCSKSKQAKLTYDPEAVSKVELLKALDKNGLNVAGQFVNLKVDGMKCGNCEESLKTALGKIDGVSSQSACHKSKQASVTFDPKKVDTKKIVSAIDEAGFSVKQ